MRAPGSARLETRLEPHVGGGFDHSRYGWWPRGTTRVDRVLARRGIRHRRRLDAELPAVVEQLAELVDGGCGLPAATARVAWRGRGPVADDLAEIAQQLRAGRAPAVVWRRWALTTGSDAVGTLASVLAIEQPTSDMAGELRRQALALRRRAHDERLAMLSRRVWSIWLAAVAQLVAIGIFIAV